MKRSTLSCPIRVKLLRKTQAQHLIGVTEISDHLPSSDMPSPSGSRERYLALLRAFSHCSAATVILVDGRKVENVGILAVRPDSSALLVSNLDTPLGTLPAAVLRGEDVVAVSARFHVHVDCANDNSEAEQ